MPRALIMVGLMLSCSGGPFSSDNQSSSSTAGSSSSGGAVSAGGSSASDGGAPTGGSSSSDGGRGSSTSNGGSSSADAGSGAAGAAAVEPELCATLPPREAWTTAPVRNWLTGYYLSGSYVCCPNGCECVDDPSAIDGKPSTRLTSGKPQAGDEWLQIDFGATVALTGVVISCCSVESWELDYARGYEVRLSNEPEAFDAPVLAAGEGMPGSIEARFAASGRYLLISQTGVDQVSWWSIDEVVPLCD